MLYICLYFLKSKNNEIHIMMKFWYNIYLTFWCICFHFVPLIFVFMMSSKYNSWNLGEEIPYVTQVFSSFPIVFQIFKDSTCCLRQLIGHLFLPNNTSWLLGSKTKKMENFWKNYQVGSCLHLQVNHMDLLVSFNAVIRQELCILQ